MYWVMKMHNAHVFQLFEGNVKIYFCVLGDHDGNVQTTMVIAMLRQHMYF